jgi:hypothetical protein
MPLEAASRFGRLLAGGLLATAHLLALRRTFLNAARCWGLNSCGANFASPKKSSCVVRPNARDGGTL